MVINTHGEVLPIPISYTDRGSSDDENTAALYDFEEGGGNVIRDASGNHHEGAMKNAQWTTDSHFGKHAMEFSGDLTERIRISRAKELAPDTFTLECSVYLKRDYVSGTDSPVAILSNEEQVGNGSGARTFGYGLTINRPTGDEGFPANLTNRLVFSVGTYGGARESIYPDTPLETGRWYRIAATYDGSHMRLYVDSEQAAAREVKYLFPASLNNLEIGASPLWGAGSNIEGMIDDVRISKNARPATESQLGTIAYEEWLGNISDWIADDGNIWVSINGSVMQKLGLREQGWPDDCAVIGGEGFSEFTGSRFPPISLIDPQGGTAERSEIGDRIAAELPNASLPASVTGAASAIPADSEMLVLFC